MSLTNALDFSGKQVLVTGGSDGIGYGVARAFLDAGASVSITGTRPQDQYDKDFSGLAYHQLNTADGETIENLADNFASLDVLANCVGTVLYKKAEFEREGFEHVLNINLTGVMHLCTAFLDLLVASKGCIINMDSVVSIHPALNNPAYSASKAGLVQLTKALAMKWGPKGVRVNTIAPGMVPTKLTANQNSPEVVQSYMDQTPLRRVGSPEDIAGAVLFFSSPLAAYATGQHLVVDGGLTL